MLEMIALMLLLQEDVRVHMAIEENCMSRSEQNIVVSTKQMLIGKCYKRELAWEVVGEDIKDKESYYRNHGKIFCYDTKVIIIIIK